MSIITEENFKVKDLNGDLSPEDKAEVDQLMGGPKLYTDSDWFDIPTNCFMCGERLLKLPLILWIAESQLWLHVDCANSLALGLIRDVLEVEHGKEKANAIYRKLKK